MVASATQELNEVCFVGGLPCGLSSWLTLQHLRSEGCGCQVRLVDSVLVECPKQWMLVYLTTDVAPMIGHVHMHPGVKFELQIYL